jgi:hypothetical protein
MPIPTEPVPHRNGTADRFEIQVAEPHVERLQRLCEAALDHDLTGVHCAELPLCRRRELFARGKVRDPLYAASEVVARLDGAHVVEPGDVLR